MQNFWPRMRFLEANRADVRNRGFALFIRHFGGYMVDRNIFAILYGG